VARLLHQTPEQKTVAVRFPDDEQGRAAEQVVRQVMEFLPQLIREHQQETLNKLTDAFLESATPRKRLLGPALDYQLSHEETLAPALKTGVDH
jgi:hypothetical protein